MLQWTMVGTEIDFKDLLVSFVYVTFTAFFEVFKYSRNMLCRLNSLNSTELSKKKKKFAIYVKRGCDSL